MPSLYLLSILKLRFIYSYSGLFALSANQEVSFFTDSLQIGSHSDLFGPDFLSQLAPYLDPYLAAFARIPALMDETITVFHRFSTPQ